MLIRTALFFLLLPLCLPAEARSPLASAAVESEIAGKAPPPPPPALSAANALKLKELVRRQKELIYKAEHAESQAQIDDLYPELQSLINDYEDFIKLTPDNPEPFIAYGMLLNSRILGERKRAAALFYKADTLDPAIPLVKNQLGNYLAEEGRPVPAINHYFAAINLAPGEPLYHYQLGNLLSAAREDFMKEMGWSRQKVDKTMLDAFRQAAALGSGNSTYAFRLGLAYFELETPDWDSALKQWTSLEASLSDPLQKQLIDIYIAKVLIQKGNTQEAMRRLGSVVDKRYQAQKQKLLDEIKSIHTK